MRYSKQHQTQLPMKHASFFLCALMGLTCMACQRDLDLDAYLAYQVSVTEQQITSSGFPAGTITVDSSLTYVGSDSFILYDIARCEIHLFVEADAEGAVERLYWFQYEGYLPSLFPRHYDYSGDPYQATIGGRAFSESVNYYNIVEDRREWRTDSDIMRVFNLLDQAGYTMDTDVMRTRLVHLDENKSQELMIMYLEAMDGQDLTIAAFGEAGKESPKWQEVSAALRARAKAGIELQFTH